MTALPLAELVEDAALFPRHAVDDIHVGRLADALRAGVTLPPIVADAASKRIVDGWSRARAYRRIQGVTAVVEVDLRTYADEAAMFADALALNSAHGRPLGRMDQARSVLIATRLGMDDARIAAILHVPAERMRELQVRVAYVDGDGTATEAGGTRTLVLKRPVAHLAGRTLSEQQAAALQSTPGTSYLLVCRQLADAVQYGLIDPRDDRLREALVGLRDALSAYLKRVPAPAEAG